MLLQVNRCFFRLCRAQHSTDRDLLESPPPGKDVSDKHCHHMASVLSTLYTARNPPIITCLLPRTRIKSRQHRDESRTGSQLIACGRIQLCFLQRLDSVVLTREVVLPLEVPQLQSSHTALKQNRRLSDITFNLHNNNGVVYETCFSA